MGRVFRWYGAGPLHLLVLLACFALSGYAAAQLVPSRPLGVAVWFAGAVIGHDLVLMPLYALADRSVLAVFRHRAPVQPAHPGWINYLRVPAGLSLLLLLVWFPLVFRLTTHYTASTGLSTAPFLWHWLAVTGALFALSAIVFAVRLRGSNLKRVPKSRKRRFGFRSKSQQVSGDPRKRPAPPAVSADSEQRAALAATLLRKAVAAPLEEPLGFAALPALVLHETRTNRPGEFPAADCVHECLTLASAYAEAGITAQVRTAELTVTDSKTGAEAVHGIPRPHWADGRFFGHTVLWLPARRHLIDPSTERYKEIAAWKAGPVIAAAGPAPEADDDPDTISIAVTRGYLHLAYTLGSETASAGILDDPAAKDGLDDDHARGLAIMSEVIRLLATEHTPAGTAVIPYPRAVTLIDAAR